MKEFIEINERNGKIKKVEVLLRFHNEENDKHYLIYQYANNYYAAKYDDVVGTSKLDPNLTNNELTMLEEMLNGIKGI